MFKSNRTSKYIHKSIQGRPDRVVGRVWLFMKCVCVVVVDDDVVIVVVVVVSIPARMPIMYKHASALHAFRTVNVRSTLLSNRAVKTAARGDSALCIVSKQPSAYCRRIFPPRYRCERLHSFAFERVTQTCRQRGTVHR